MKHGKLCFTKATTDQTKNQLDSLRVPTTASNQVKHKKGLTDHKGKKKS